MNFRKKTIIALFLVNSIVCGSLFFYRRSGLVIRDVTFDKDFAAIDALFHKEDNWFWMICNEHLDTFPLEKLLRYKMSNPYDNGPHNDLTTRVVEVDGKIAGFTAYYPKSKHVWQFLFLIVDQDFRGKGLAKKLLMYAAKDMVAHGAVKVDMVTRIENVKARSLYRQFGFKQVGTTKQHVLFAWYPSWGLPSWKV